MNNSLLLYTPFSEGKIITVTDPETGQPVQQVVQTVTDPETGKPTQITTPLPGTFWNKLFLFWNNAHNFFYIISAAATNISNQIPNTMGGQIVNVTDPDTGQTIQQVVQNTIDPKTGKTIQVTIPLNSIQNNGKLSKHLTYQFYINYIQIMCCETVLLIILHDDTFFYFCLSN